MGCDIGALSAFALFPVIGFVGLPGLTEAVFVGKFHSVTAIVTSAASIAVCVGNSRGFLATIALGPMVILVKMPSRNKQMGMHGCGRYGGGGSGDSRGGGCGGGICGWILRTGISGRENRKIGKPQNQRGDENCADGLCGNGTHGRTPFWHNNEILPQPKREVNGRGAEKKLFTN